MMPHLPKMSPVLWAGLAVAALSWPIFLGFLGGLLPSVRPFFRGDRSRWFTFWRVTVVALWVVAATVVALMRSGGVTLRTVNAVPPNAMTLLIVLVALLLLIAAALAASARDGGPAPTGHGTIFLPHTRRERLFMLLVIAPSAALCEEVVYRGFLLVLLAPLIGSWPANAVQASLFGFHHGGVRQGVMPFLARTGIGVVFGFMAMRMGSLSLVVAIHYLLDAAFAVAPSRGRALADPA
jgi:membrane protease YdiL (CAAX protease family)